MKRIFPVLALTLLAAAAIYAQTPAPSPPPPPADETDVVKITTTLIQLDVTVTDKKGNVVTDLRPDEVEVYENGKKQPISNFSFVSNVHAVDSRTKSKRDKNEVILPGTPVREENVRRTIALVVDDLTLSFESTFYVRRALKKFVDEQMQPGDLVAILRTGAGIGALQQFTTDKRQLYAAIEKVRWNSIGAGNIGAFAPLDARMDTGPDQEEARPGNRTENGVDDEFEDFRDNLFATGTLGAVNYVVRGMQDLPGRKSILLLSDGFSLFTKDASGYTSTNRVFFALRRLVDMANRAAVVVYTMDARGLQYTGLTAADNTGGRSIEQLEEELSDRRNRLLDTQQGLRYLARQTGGLAIINNNDLVGGIRRILDDQSYYLVAYEPDDDTFDPKIRRFHKLEVKVKRPGTSVRYRSGFFGVSDEKLVRSPQTPAQRLVGAVMSPFALQDISLRLNALYYNKPKDGNVIRSLVHIRAQDLVFKDAPEGGKEAIFDVIAAAFGDNGTVADQLSKTYTLRLKKDAVQQFMERGFVYDFSFPIKKPGAYQLRIALRDHGGDKIGSAHQFVEVPNLKKERLQLSGAVLENFAFSDWKKQEAGEQVSGRVTNSAMDTSVRQFKRNTVLRYGLTIYNSKQAPATNLSSQTRLYRDGRMIFEGKVLPIEPSNLPGSPQDAVHFNSALALGDELPPGDYVLQISITDNLRKSKKGTSVQFVQFEIVE